MPSYIVSPFFGKEGWKDPTTGLEFEKGIRVTNVYHIPEEVTIPNTIIKAIRINALREVDSKFSRYVATRDIFFKVEDFEIVKPPKKVMPKDEEKKEPKKVVEPENKEVEKKTPARRTRKTTTSTKK